MSQFTINIGDQADDGLGEAIRTGFEKVNANFDELFASIGSGGLKFQFTEGLTELNLASKSITAITGELPSSLTRLYLTNNQLTSLPTLPAAITLLYCDVNQLTSVQLDIIIAQLNVNGQSNGRFYWGSQSTSESPNTEAQDYIDLIAKGWTIAESD